MPRYVASVLATRMQGVHCVGTVHVHRVDMVHYGFVVESASVDEARGLAIRFAERRYPDDEGWYDRYAFVSPFDDILDATVLDATMIGRVVPYPAPFSLRVPAGEST